MKNVKTAVVALILSYCTAAQAVPALTSFSGGFDSQFTPDSVVGWQFTANSDISVTALGAYDFGGDGISDSHDIGIFRVSDQALVTSTTLVAGTSGLLDGDFRYVSLASAIDLAIGDYVILMTVSEISNDPQRIFVSSFATAPEITWVQSANGVGSTLAYPPASDFGGFNGVFGPNFQFDAISVPEPSTLALLGIAGLAAAWRRKQK